MNGSELLERDIANAAAAAERVRSVEDLKKALELVHIADASPRFRTAVEAFNSGAAARDVLVGAIHGEKHARDLWVSSALQPWCERHGITLHQGLSIAFDDGAYDPQNPGKDRVTLRDLSTWNGQQNDFAMYLMKEPRPHNSRECKASVSFAKDAYSSMFLDEIKNPATIRSAASWFSDRIAGTNPCHFEAMVPTWLRLLASLLKEVK